MEYFEFSIEVEIDTLRGKNLLLRSFVLNKYYTIFVHSAFLRAFSVFSVVKFNHREHKKENTEITEANII